MTTKHLKPIIFLIAAAMLLNLAACISENPFEPTPDGEGRTLTLRIDNGESTTTRAESPHIPCGTPVEIQRGIVYLLDNDGVILAHYTIGAGADIEIDDLKAAPYGATITNVSPDVTQAVIVGNTANNATSGWISAVGERLIDIVQQFDAENVNLWGSGEFDSNNRADITMYPTVARVEIADITATGQIAEFTVAGIFIDHYHPQAQVDGTIPTANNLVSHGQDPDVFQGGTLGEYGHDIDFAIHDWFGENGRQSIDRVAQPATDDFVWGYQVFARHDSEVQDGFTPQDILLASGGSRPIFNQGSPTPRIIIRFSSIEFADGTVIDEPRFLTIALRTTGGPLTGVHASYVYRIDAGELVFDYADLSPRPNEGNYIDVYVSISRAHWSRTEVIIPGFRQPNPIGTPEGQPLTGIPAAWEFPLGAAINGRCTDPVAYRWERNVSTQTNPDPDNPAHWEPVPGVEGNLHLANREFTAMGLTQTTWFRRVAASCGDEITSAPARVEVFLPFLRVTPGMWLFAPTNALPRIFEVETNVDSWQIAGWVNPVTGAVSPTPPTGISVSATTATTFTVSAANNTGAERGGILRITAGGLTQDIHIRQLTARNEELAGRLENAYIGAFWREAQSGERLIRIPMPTAHSGHEWMAIAFDNWIMLDRELLPTVQPGEEVTDPEDSQLSRPTASDRVSGTGGISFRIGLDGTIGAGGSVRPNAANPTPNATISGGHYTHRWGRVAVLWGANQENLHIIWVRQGEQAHFVFTPTCPGAVRNTENVKRWSPFNLTHPNIRDYGAATATFPARAAMTDDDNFFTDYPSQAGAFLQWATNTPDERRAWSPVNDVVDWRTAVTSSGSFWDSSVVNHGDNNLRETCPVGWVRPGIHTHAAFGAAQIGSCVFRQSLWLTADRGFSNSVFGFYADGFFDRRVIATPLWGPGPGLELTVRRYSAVDINSTNIAFTGRLFFNPSTGYHLFLPAAGARSSTITEGWLRDAGSIGFYWGRTAPSLGTQGQGMFAAGTVSGFGGQSRGTGFKVRCVRE